jgi:hypothetical protein
MTTRPKQKQAITSIDPERLQLLDERFAALGYGTGSRFIGARAPCARK